MTSVKLTLIVVAVLPVFVGLAAAFGWRLRALSREAQDCMADTNVVVEETLQGIATVKAFAREDFERGRFRLRTASLIDNVVKTARQQGAFLAFMSLSGTGVLVVVLWYGCRLIEAGDLTIGQMSQFMLYAMYVGGAAGHFARLYADLQRMLGATHRVRELLAERPECAELIELEQSVAAPSIPRIAGSVEFASVSFSYPGRREAVVLRDLSLTVQSGERVALVGPSGAGKSTVVSLLLQFYPPDAGRILIDGKDAAAFPRRALRSQIAIVPQDVLLFGGTIAENIGYGKSGATPAEIEEAARKANAHDFICGFPAGYETIVGERGTQLSGGQRQRVAIARAVLRDPAILILDEATSSLDSESENLVRQALDSLMEGRTSIIIAHRLSTVRGADRIYVIQQGAVVEAGTHGELLSRSGGLYRMLAELQFGSEVNDVAGQPALEPVNGNSHTAPSGPGHSS